LQPKTLQNLEKGKKDPTIPMLKQIAAAEGVPLVNLLKGELHIHNIEVNEGGINNKDVTINKGIAEEKLDKVIDMMVAIMQKMGNG
jgi:transcriptional regulator with XRE-family HTH domain